MKKFIYLFSIILVILINFSGNVFADITLPSIFGDHMVLQQQTDAAIWGEATPNKSVDIVTSWDAKSYQTIADKNGNWKIKVKTPEAGGPFSISISDGTPFKLNNILIGEVWVCSGQSNMEMPMKGYRNQAITGSQEAIATSNNQEIRLFTVKKDKSLETNTDFEGNWKECKPGNVVDFSATAYFFGRMLQQAMGVPVGLICSSWGGTRIEPWMSENGFKKFDWVNLPDKSMEGDLSPQTPTVLYNAMIAPMVGYAIKGGIWYQGESNRNEPHHYEKLMPGLIENWRSEWGIGDFPFYYCQIAPFDYGRKGLNSALLREAQFKASDDIPNIGMACLMDTGEKHNIHPANKKAAGERLAYQALANSYGINGIEFSGPVLKELVVENNMVYLTFDHANNGLTTFGKDIENFMVAGENKRFFSARALLSRKGITLFSEYVPKPVAVRYAFEDFVIGELFNTEGLPASSFRTDDWEIE